MNKITRYLLATAVFLTVLGAELLLVFHFVPDFSNKEIHDFMLISMGMAFIPFFLALGVAAVVFGILVLVAAGIARLIAPKKKITIGEAWSRKARQAGGPNA